MGAPLRSARTAVVHRDNARHTSPCVSLHIENAWSRTRTETLCGGQSRVRAWKRTAAAS